MRLNVSPFDGVVVVLPKRLGQWVNTDRFVKENGAWLMKHMEIAGLTEQNNGIFSGDDIRDGQVVLYQGEEFTLSYQVTTDPRPSIVVEPTEGRIEVLARDHGPDEVAKVLRKWMVAEAKDVLSTLAREKAVEIGVSYRSLRVRTLKSKWGSCSTEGDLTFNWRLILFPREIQRYVVVHELCHLVHFDHSRKFWRLVAEHEPSFRDAVRWLKSEGVNARSLMVGL